MGDDARGGTGGGPSSVPLMGEAGSAPKDREGNPSPATLMTPEHNKAVPLARVFGEASTLINLVKRKNTGSG